MPREVGPHLVDRRPRSARSVRPEHTCNGIPQGPHLARKHTQLHQHGRETHVVHQLANPCFSLHEGRGPVQVGHECGRVAPLGESVRGIILL